MLKGGMTRDQVGEFVFGQFADAATKVMKAVTFSPCSKDDSRWCCCSASFAAKVD